MAFVTPNSGLLRFKRHSPSVCRQRSRAAGKGAQLHASISTSTSPSASPAAGGGDWDLRLGSPSKINLFLRVVNRRADGFHDLASLFQTISLHDTLYFAVKHDATEKFDSLECDIPGIPTDESNLVMKALKTYRQHSRTDKYFRVRLEKTIPHEAGLGGGSSNAATALWAANELSGKPCTRQQLIEYGSEFGSDISFFFAANGSAFCTGRGEIVNDVNPALNFDDAVYIVKPPEGLSTGMVFKTLDIDSCSKSDPLDLLSQMQRDIQSAEFVNDLEHPSFQLVPRLQEIKLKLYEEGFKVVMMSGSGTSFFCLGQPRDVDDFKTNFAQRNNVKIFEAAFEQRKSADSWYFG